MRSLIVLIFALALQAAAAPPSLAALMRRYAHDDARLATALRYERVQSGVREQV